LDDCSVWMNYGRAERRGRAAAALPYERPPPPLTRRNTLPSMTTSPTVAIDADGDSVMLQYADTVGAPSQAEPTNEIYVIELEDGYLYVGDTSNLSKRIELYEEASRDPRITHAVPKFVQLHPFVRLVSSKPKRSVHDENNTVIEEMIRLQQQKDVHFVDRVRGGSFCNETLSTAEKHIISSMIATATMACYKCHAQGHVAQDCKSSSSSSSQAHTTASGEDFLNAFKSLMTFSSLSSSPASSTKAACFRCGFRSHLVADCTARKDIDGKWLPCQNCGSTYHAVNACTDSTSSACIVM